MQTFGYNHRTTLEQAMKDFNLYSSVQPRQGKEISHPHIKIVAVWKYTVLILSEFCKAQFLRQAA